MNWKEHGTLAIWTRSVGTTSTGHLQKATGVRVAGYNDGGPNLVVELGGLDRSDRRHFINLSLALYNHRDHQATSSRISYKCGMSSQETGGKLRSLRVAEKVGTRNASTVWRLRQPIVDAIDSGEMFAVRCLECGSCFIPDVMELGDCSTCGSEDVERFHDAVQNL